MRLKAGALQLVLFIGVLVCVLLMAFVLLISTKNQFQAKQSVLISLIQKGQALPSTSSNTYWGLYELSTQNPHFKNQEWKSQVLLGSPTNKATALYLTDQNFPVVLAGDAKIYGDAHLPERGIKRGNIRGLSYQGDYLIYGQEKKSTKALPALSPALKNQVEALFNGSLSGNRIHRLPAKLSVSFEEPAHLYESDVIVLERQKLNGHILIKASQKIIIKPEADLFGVVLIAPQIEIQSGVYGSFQAFASKHLSTGKQVELAYPSLLCVYDQTVPSKETVPPVKLEIGEESNLRGSLLYLQKTASTKIDRNPDILIPETTIIDGQVYCEDSLDLQGQVNGVVYTALFQTFQNGSNYVNHLFNGQINRSALPHQFAGIPIGNYNQKALVQWVD